MIPTLLPYQSRWVEDGSRLKVCEKGRRIGLSWAEAYDDVVHAAAGKGDVYYQSYAHDMTKGFIDDCAFWAQSLQVAAAEVGETVLDIDGEQIPAYRLPLASGKEIFAVTSAPRAFRSKGRPGDRAVLDEAAFVDSLAECLKAALAFLTWGGSVRVISTHNGEGSQFNTLARAIEEGSRTGSLHTIRFMDAVLEGLYQRICRETGEIWTQAGQDAWVAEIYDTYGDGADEELDCIPSPLGGSWLSWELLRACEEDYPDPVEETGRTVRGDPSAYAGGPTYIGNDIGRRNDLWVAWVVEIVGDVAWTREIVELRNASFSDQDDELDRLVARYRPVRIAMDQTGMGEKPVEDAMLRYGEHRVEGVLLTLPRRLDVATALKERYQDRLWRAPRDKTVRQDLHSVRVEQGATGGPRLLVDEDQKESHADRFWAGALAAAAAANPAPKYEYRAAVPRQPAAKRGRRWRRSDRDADDLRPGAGRFGGFVGRAVFGKGGLP